MSFKDFWKKLIGNEEAADAELDAARARHGIEADTPRKRMGREEREMAENFDLWEELKHFQANMFLGRWASKKLGIIGEDKLKKQLEELEQKRQAREAEKEEKQGE